MQQPNSIHTEKQLGGHLGSCESLLTVFVYLKKATGPIHKMRKKTAHRTSFHTAKSPQNGSFLVMLFLFAQELFSLNACYAVFFCTFCEPFFCDLVWNLEIHSTCSISLAFSPFLRLRFFYIKCTDIEYRCLLIVISIYTSYDSCEVFFQTYLVV